MFRNFLSSCCLVAVCTGMLCAQDATDLTADELMLRADAARNEKRYGEAAKLYQKFIDDFGKSQEPQVQDLIRRRRYDLAICYLQEKQFAEAGQAMEAALALEPPLETRQLQELQFWLGVCQMQEKEYEAARATFEKFLGMFRVADLRNPRYRTEFPATKNIDEARILMGTALVLEEKFAEAAQFFAQVKGSMGALDRGRATVLELYALLQAGEQDAALKLVREESGRSGDFLQLVAFQTLVLQLGDKLLEEGRLRDGISCLHHVWSRDRLLKHQRARMEDLESRLAAAKLAEDPALEISLTQQLTKVRREIENFTKIEHFDSALRLRLARTYQMMGRYRESALIMEQMLHQMSPDPLVEQASRNLVQSWYAIERWPKVAEAAEEFSQVFPNSESLPLVRYLAGIALQKDLNYPASIAEFQKILDESPDSEYAPRARFMKEMRRQLKPLMPSGRTTPGTNWRMPMPTGAPWHSRSTNASRKPASSWMTI
jgi:tetratricopeptide (TPR) repeat protein